MAVEHSCTKLRRGADKSEDADLTVGLRRAEAMLAPNMAANQGARRAEDRNSNQKTRRRGRAVSTTCSRLRRGNLGVCGW
jgi:hypothetical protein